MRIERQGARVLACVALGVMLAMVLMAFAR
jgi:hypothetical protein